ncbi:hypothetical protein Hanom_Chr08g00730631 [Helianthus anomalus]
MLEKKRLGFYYNEKLIHKQKTIYLGLGWREWSPFGECLTYFLTNNVMSCEVPTPLPILHSITSNGQTHKEW